MKNMNVKKKREEREKEQQKEERQWLEHELEMNQLEYSKGKSGSKP